MKPPEGGWTFRVDDEILQELDAGDARVWEWTPGFYAGEVNAELVSPEAEVVAAYILDVSPDPNKLGAAVFQDMIDEVSEEDPSLLFGREPSTAPIGTLGKEQDPLLEYARLRRYGDDFLYAVGDIARHPIQTLRYHREAMPTYLVRRADRRTALTALSRPGVARLLKGDGDPEGPLFGSTPMLDVPSYEWDLDGAANRCMCAMIQGVHRRTLALRQALAQSIEGEETSETRTALARRWPVRKLFLDRLAEDLQSALRRLPFSAVRKPEISAAGLNAISAHPIYARAYSLGWQAVRHGLLGSVTAERLWISPTWEIYERWCFVRLGKAFRQAFPQLQWRRLECHGTGARAAWQGTGAKGNKVELLLQPKFPSHSYGRQPRFWSLSRLCIPDLVLTYESPLGGLFIVLDAKYRHARATILDGMAESAHLYHDALRLGDKRPELAVLLVPASGGAPWLEDPEFLFREGVGVIAITPDAVADIPSTLRKIIDHSTCIGPIEAD